MAASLALTGTFITWEICEREKANKLDIYDSHIILDVFTDACFAELNEEDDESANKLHCILIGEDSEGK